MPQDTLGGNSSCEAAPEAYYDLLLKSRQTARRIPSYRVCCTITSETGVDRSLRITMLPLSPHMSIVCQIRRRMDV